MASKTTYKQRFNKKYGFPKNESHSLNEISKLTGVSKKGLKQIYEKGEGAFYSNPSSVRKNVKSPQQWAMARVYSSVMGGKASKVDAKELKMEKGGKLFDERKEELQQIAEGEKTIRNSKRGYDKYLTILKDLKNGLKKDKEINLMGVFINIGNDIRRYNYLLEKYSHIIEEHNITDVDNWLLEDEPNLKIYPYTIDELEDVYFKVRGYKGGLKNSFKQGGTINDLPFYQRQENELLDLIKEKKAERQEFWDKGRESKDYSIKSELNNKAWDISQEINELNPKVNFLKNITFCLSNGGSLVNFTDNLGFEHKEICDFRGISTDNFDFSEEEILELPQPKYIPYFNRKELERKGFVVEAIKYTDDSYIVALGTYNEKSFKKGTLQLVILNLDQLALSLDYYYTKAKAENRAEAKRQNKRNEENFLNKSEQYRENFYNQNRFYFSLPAKLRKTISEVEWNNLSLAEKQELYLPVKKYKGKRITAKLTATEMYLSYVEMYLRFVDKSKTVENFVKEGIKNAKTEDEKLRLKQQLILHNSGRSKTAHPDIFKYYFEFRDAMKFKTIDIRIQRTALSETYQKGMETSYGRSGVDKRLYNEFGIVVKRQNGERISVMDFDQIKEGWMDCVKVFGNLKPLSEKYQMVVSHSSRKYQFANKRAIGIFIPTIPAIGVSSKFGEVQFKTTMAHEVAHFLDYCVGQIRGLRYSTDDFDSTSGKLVKLFRDNMNLASSEQNDYINSSKECFARAFEQYFSYKLYGFDGKVEYSEGQVEDDNYFENDNYVSRGMWGLIEPLIEKFLDENKDVLEFTVDLDQTDEKEPIGVEEEIEFLIQKEENLKIKKGLEILKSNKMAKDLTKKDIEYLSEVIDSQYIPDKWKKKASEMVEETKSESKENFDVFIPKGKFIKKTESYYTKDEIDEIEKEYTLDSHQISAITLPKNFDLENAEMIMAKNPYDLESRGNAFLKKLGVDTNKYGLSYNPTFGKNPKPISNAYGIYDDGFYQLLYVYERTPETIKWTSKFGSESWYEESEENEQLVKALKGIEIAISLAGETKELLKAKKGIEIAINLL